VHSRIWPERWQAGLRADSCTPRRKGDLAGPIRSAGVVRFAGGEAKPFAGWDPIAVAPDAPYARRENGEIVALDQGGNSAGSWSQMRLRRPAAPAAGPAAPFSP